MLGIFLGGQNSGKTLSMVYYAYDYYKNGYDIYSNLKLNFPYTPLTKKTLTQYTEGQKQFRKSVFLIDELYLFMDSRRSFSKNNQIFSYFLLQTSKRNVHCLSTSQYISSVEKRFRENLTFQCFCERVIKNDDGLYYEVGKVNRKLSKAENERLYIKNAYLKKVNNMFDYKVKLNIVYLKAKPLFDFYDTTELLAL